MCVYIFVCERKLCQVFPCKHLYILSFICIGLKVIRVYVRMRERARVCMCICVFVGVFVHFVFVHCVFVRHFRLYLLYIW